MSMRVLSIAILVALSFLPATANANNEIYVSISQPGPMQQVAEYPIAFSFFTYGGVGGPYSTTCTFDNDSQGAIEHCASPGAIPWLPDGTHTLTVTVRDALGNSNSESVPFVVNNPNWIWGSGVDWSNRLGTESAPCSDYEIIGVRGSRGGDGDNDPMDFPLDARDDQVAYFMARMREFILYADTRRTQARGVTVSIPQWVQYPAEVAYNGIGVTKFGTFSKLVAKMLGPAAPAAENELDRRALSYVASVRQGAAELRRRLASRRDHCRNERDAGNPSKFILAGYSQGAQVINEAIDGGMNLTDVHAIALLGDPYFSRKHSGKPLLAVAEPKLWGEHEGVIRPRTNDLPDPPTAYSGCILGDSICSGKISLAGFAHHSKYNKCITNPAGQWPPISFLLAAAIARESLHLSISKNGGYRACDGDTYTNGPSGNTFRASAMNPFAMAESNEEELPPVAILPQESLDVIQGSVVDLSATGSFDVLAEPLTYEWDTDGDGDFDILQADPQLELTYVLQPTGPITLRVTNESGLSATAQMTLTISPAGLAVPGAPEAPLVRQIDGGVDVSWGPPATGLPIENYRVYDAEDMRPLYDTTDTSIQFDDLTIGSAASFRVAASNAAFAGPPSVASVPVMIVEHSEPTGSTDPTGGTGATGASGPTDSTVPSGPTGGTGAVGTNGETGSIGPSGQSDPTGPLETDPIPFLPPPFTSASVQNVKTVSRFRSQGVTVKFAGLVARSQLSVKFSAASRGRKISLGTVNRVAITSGAKSIDFKPSSNFSRKVKKLRPPVRVTLLVTGTSPAGTASTSLLNLSLKKRR